MPGFVLEGRIQPLDHVEFLIWTTGYVEFLIWTTGYDCTNYKL
jgi:hypothetical protein